MSWYMWNLSSLTRDQTMDAVLKAQSLNHWVTHLIFQVHELLEGTSSLFLSSSRYPVQDLWLQMLVEWMFKCKCHWPKMFKSVTLSLHLVGRVKWWWSVWSLGQGRALSVQCIVSPWCEGWFILICVHSLERGHSHRALEFVAGMLMLLLKSISFSLLQEGNFQGSKKFLPWWNEFDILWHCKQSHPFCHLYHLCASWQHDHS